MRYVKVLYVGNRSKRYDGQNRFQSLDNIIKLNGESVNGETLTLETLDNGDEIKFLNMNKEWNGVVAEDKPDANNSYEPGRKRKVGYTVEKHPAKKKKLYVRK